MITAGDFKNGLTFETALESREFEPDAPNLTPRISGMLTFDEGDFTFESGFADKFPKELSLEAETLQCKVGRYLAAKIEEHRA